MSIFSQIMRNIEEDFKQTEKYKKKLLQFIQDKRCQNINRFGPMHQHPVRQYEKEFIKTNQTVPKYQFLRPKL